MVNRPALRGLAISVLVSGGLLVGCNNSEGPDSQSPTSPSDATSSSSQKASESTETRCWPATEGEDLCGVMTSVEGRRGDAEAVDLKGALTVEVTPDPAGDGYSLLATADGCQLWTTPLTGTAPRWTPHPDRRTDSAMGCDSPTDQPDWVMAMLDKPFTVQVADTEVVFQGEEAEITFTQPKNATPKG
ncbi:hypothetical protein SAMN05445756_0661 [Kytococcus aerolatus]|uniref:Uncharacterized protein n=1 Tax=Kytococcus aerolatus TaxID=592308 RepID=A0A212T899_9MICO|nr:hypothetical protein [Kytococcus aerolatus]SNC62287.1 hypothetical protein SAMN05445756_0661 [Kytococcus aerolatus]